jgi:predicted transposase/invertase (TIGR01784 family)
MQFLDVKTDYAFKKVFGSKQNTPLLLSFLNSIIYPNSSTKIDSLTIVDPYNIPMIKGVKDTFVDVKAILTDGSLVIIEMQVLNHQGFEKRVLYNAAKNYSIQLNKGEDYHLLNPVIGLSIVDFIMFDDNDSVMNHFKLLEKEQLIQYSDDIELIFIELPKFTKHIDALQDIQDQWIYFIKNAENLEYLPKNLDNDVQTALGVVNEANMSLEELEAQHKRKEFIYIQKNSITLAEEKALKKGVETGMEVGMEKGRTEGIIGMYQLGIDADKIATYYKISVTEVELIIHHKNSPPKV